VLIDISDPSLFEANWANFIQFFLRLEHSPVVRFSRGTGWVRWHTEIPHPWFNAVLSGAIPEVDAPAVIQDTLAYFAQNEVNGITWWFERDAPHDHIDQHLLSAGFQKTAGPPMMAVSLDRLERPPAEIPGFKIERVGDLDQLALYSQTFLDGYGLPTGWAETYTTFLASLGIHDPLRHYIGFYDGQPVATATIFLAAGVAGIYNVATLPAARGKGYGGAMTSAPLLEARRLGYRAGILQSSEMGFSVYSRLGFRKVGDLEHFSWTTPDRQD
jgi:GNAT superfamily N-acetyltransferase